MLESEGSSLSSSLISGTAAYGLDMTMEEAVRDFVECVDAVLLENSQKQATTSPSPAASAAGMSGMTIAPLVPRLQHRLKGGKLQYNCVLRAYYVPPEPNERRGRVKVSIIDTLKALGFNVVTSDVHHAIVFPRLPSSAPVASSTTMSSGVRSEQQVPDTTSSLCFVEVEGVELGTIGANIARVSVLVPPYTKELNFTRSEEIRAFFSADKCSNWVFVLAEAMQPILASINFLYKITFSQAIDISLWHPILPTPHQRSQLQRLQRIRDVFEQLLKKMNLTEMSAACRSLLDCNVHCVFTQCNKLVPASLASEEEKQSTSMLMDTWSIDFLDVLLKEIGEPFVKAFDTTKSSSSGINVTHLTVYSDPLRPVGIGYSNGTRKELQIDTRMFMKKFEASSDITGIDGTLHFVAPLKRPRRAGVSSSSSIVKLFDSFTINVRAVHHCGIANTFVDLVLAKKSILFIGAAKSWKTSILRDVGRLVTHASPHLQLFLVDTFGDLMGRGEKPCPCAPGTNFRGVYVGKHEKQSTCVREASSIHGANAIIIDETLSEDDIKSIITLRTSPSMIVHTSVATSSLIGFLQNDCTITASAELRKQFVKSFSAVVEIVNDCSFVVHHDATRVAAGVAHKDVVAFEVRNVHYGESDEREALVGKKKIVRGVGCDDDDDGEASVSGYMTTRCELFRYK